MFGLESSTQLLEQLKQDYKHFEKVPLNKSLGMGLATLLWHIADWYYEEVKVYSSDLDKGEFRKVLFEKCGELRLLHDIANISKHKKLDRAKADIIKTESKSGFNSAYSSAYYKANLAIVTENGQEYSLTKTLEIVITFWEEELRS